MKTPGPLPYLTPNGSLPSGFQPQFQSQLSVHCFNMSEFKTPCAEIDPTEKIIFVGHQHHHQQPSYNNSNANQQFRTQDSIDGSVYVNPNQIFVGQPQSDNAIPEYTKLTNVPDINGSHQVRRYYIVKHHIFQKHTI